MCVTRILKNKKYNTKVRADLYKNIGPVFILTGSWERGEYKREKKTEHFYTF